MLEQERLKQYFPCPSFNESVLDTVAEVADKQRASSWESIRGSLPATTVFTTAEGSSIELMDIQPDDYDETWVYHMPMGNSLSDNMLIRIATLTTAAPDKRIIAVGNPGIPGQGIGKLPLKELPGVWSGDLRATIDPIMRYLSDQSVEKTVHIGFSYGAEKAASATKYASKYDQIVADGLYMEPVAIQQRGWVELIRNFQRTQPALQGYIDATASQPVQEAHMRAAEKSLGLTGYVLGLLRLSNIAISHVLTGDSFESRVNESLITQYDMKAHLVWGTFSEMAKHDLMCQIEDRLIMKFGTDRINTSFMVGQKHAMGDDVFLHAAMVLQALIR